MKKILILSFLVLFVTGCGCEKSTETKTKELEANMKEMVDEFYVKNIKSNVTGITEQKVTLDQLKSLDYDTSILVNPETGKLCSSKSYSLVIVKNPSEANSDYTIENHLVCGDYKTKN